MLAAREVVSVTAAHSELLWQVGPVAAYRTNFMPREAVIHWLPGWREADTGHWRDTGAYIVIELDSCPLIYGPVESLRLEVGGKDFTREPFTPVDALRSVASCSSSFSYALERCADPTTKQHLRDGQQKLWRALRELKAFVTQGKSSSTSGDIKVLWQVGAVEAVYLDAWKQLAVTPATPYAWSTRGSPRVAIIYCGEHIADLEPYQGSSPRRAADRLREMFIESPRPLHPGQAIDQQKLHDAAIEIDRTSKAAPRSNTSSARHREMFVLACAGLLFLLVLVSHACSG